MERHYGIPRRQRYLKIRNASLADRAAGSARGLPRRPASEGTLRTATPGSAAADPSNAAELPRLGEYSRRMSEVRDHGELGEVILDFAAERMQRCILFHVEQDRAGIANWRGVQFGKRTIERVSLPLEPDSIFALALEEPCFHGALPREFDCSKYYGQLGIEVPREVLVAPIYGESQLEAVLYGDGGREGKVAGPTETYRLLLDEVSLALRMLASRRQLSPA
jgi:hypothetical protein